MRTLEFPTRFMAFSDVHGNLPALEAVLADAERRGLRHLVCLGDLVGYGPFPNEVAETIRERDIPTLMGNYDQGIGFQTGDCGCVYRTDAQRAEGAASLEWTQGAVTESTRAFLRTLNDRFMIRTPCGDVLAVHGSPRRINEYLFEDRPDHAMARLVRETPVRVLLFGHTHVPYVRDVATGVARQPQTRFVNVGSAGRPKDGDWRACYAVIDPNVSSEAGPSVEFARVPYDHERLIAQMARTGLITSFDGPGGAPVEDLPDP